MQRLGYQLLADVGTVGVGGVDEVDTEVDGSPQPRLRRLGIVRRSPAAVARDSHRAEAETPDLEVAAEAQRAGRRGIGALDRHVIEVTPRRKARNREAD